MRIAALILVAATLLPACQDTGQHNALPTADVVAADPRDGESVTLRRGQSLEIRLHGNETIDPPLTWSVAATPSQLRGSGEEVVSDDPRADGAGATWIFRFTAVAAGRGRLVFDGGVSGRQVALDVTVGAGPVD